MTEHVEVADRDGIITVTMNRPERLNAVSMEMTEAYWFALEQLSARDDLRSMVITAVGKYFAAGIDLETMPTRFPPPEEGSPHAGWHYRRHYRRIHALYDEMEAVEKPVVLAAQGICLGAGVEMALASDFRFCTPRARFGLPEAGIGILPASGGCSRLIDLVGPGWAKYMAMAGRQVDADKALAIGLVHDVFPEETFLDDVYAFCREMAEAPAEVVGLAKTAINVNGHLDPFAQRHVERLANSLLHDSEEHQRRIERFRR